MLKLITEKMASARKTKLVMIIMEAMAMPGADLVGKLSTCSAITAPPARKRKNPRMARRVSWKQRCTKCFKEE